MFHEEITSLGDPMTLMARFDGVFSALVVLASLARSLAHQLLIYPLANFSRTASPAEEILKGGQVVHDHAHYQ